MLVVEYRQEFRCLKHQRLGRQTVAIDFLPYFEDQRMALCSINTLTTFKHRQQHHTTPPSNHPTSTFCGQSTLKTKHDHIEHLIQFRRIWHANATQERQDSNIQKTAKKTQIFFLKLFLAFLRFLTLKNNFSPLNTLIACLVNPCQFPLCNASCRPQVLNQALS